MLISVRSKTDKLWRLKFLGTGRFKQNEEGADMTFTTKSLCEAARRTFERGATNIDREPTDFMRRRRS